MFLVKLGGRESSADIVDDSPLSGSVRRNIKRTMVDLNMRPEGTQEGSNVELGNADIIKDNVEINPDDGDDADDEPMEIPDDGDEEEEINYYGDTQIVLIQPAISRPYDRSNHFSRLNLDAMTSDWSFIHGGPERIQAMSSRLDNNLRTRRKSCWQLRGTTSGELCSIKY
ncbi:hypothetical protein AHAS_Ahas12G0107300 [Arachis hypogaea]